MRLRKAHSVLAVFFVAITVSSLFLYGLYGEPGDGRAAGSWLMRYGLDEGNNWSYPLYRVESIALVESSGQTLTYVGVDSNPWGHGGPAEGSHVSDHVGTLVKTGPNTYQFRIIYHEAGEAGYPPYCPAPPCVERSQLLTIWVWTGTARVVGDTMEKDGIFVGYSAADSDLNQDGLPDEGAEPFYSIPWRTMSERIR